MVGKSKTAGFMGVAQTSVTRCMMVPASCLLLPPVVIGGARRYVSSTCITDLDVTVFWFLFR